MAVAPDKMMELIRSQQGGGAAAPATPPPPPGAEMTPAGGMSDQTTPPMGAPMSTPEPKMGNKEGAMVNISMAMDLIEQALPSLGSETEDGQKALAAIRSLTTLLGPKKQKTRAAIAEDRGGRYGHPTTGRAVRTGVRT